MFSVELMALIEAQRGRHSAGAATTIPAGEAGTVEQFEAACAGVRAGFPHLSAQDIATPPHQWFDAALARQIALHIMATRFGAPKRRIAEELERSREAINRALETVDGRLASPEFADAYEAMAAAAEQELTNRRTET